MGKSRPKLLQTAQESARYQLTGGGQRGGTSTPVAGGAARHAPYCTYTDVFPGVGQTYISTVSYQRPLFWQSLMFAWN